MAEVFSRTEQGFGVVGLRTKGAELEVVPALGGRIIGLRSLRTGRQWCWHQQRADWLWSNRPGDSFGLSTQAGVDECIPSVEACLWKGKMIPDHGEVWAVAWDLDRQELASGSISATVPLSIMPFVFSRRIRADASGEFILEYVLVNNGALPQEFMWCLHPLFSIREGDELKLPTEVSEIRLNGGVGDRPMKQGDVWPYPEPFAGIRLDRLETPGMPSGCVKGFTGPLTTGRASIANEKDGDRLELSWDVNAAPYLGLWLNRGHGGFHHVALEPTNAAPDSLRDAVEKWRNFGTIMAGGTLRWSVRIGVR